MPQRFSEELRQKWKENILKQRESGLSIPRWCSQNNIPVYNFRYWQNKLFPVTLDRNTFTEISKDRTKFPNPGLRLQYFDFQIHLDRQFDTSALKECLKALKEVGC